MFFGWDALRACLILRHAVTKQTDLQHACSTWCVYVCRSWQQQHKRLVGYAGDQACVDQACTQRECPVVWGIVCVLCSVAAVAAWLDLVWYAVGHLLVLLWTGRCVCEGLLPGSRTCSCNAFVAAPACACWCTWQMPRGVWQARVFSYACRHVVLLPTDRQHPLFRIIAASTALPAPAVHASVAHGKACTCCKSCVRYHWVVGSPGLTCMCLCVLVCVCAAHCLVCQVVWSGSILQDPVGLPACSACMQAQGPS